MLNAKNLTRASILAVVSAATASFGAPTPVAVSGTAAPGGGTYATFTNAVLNVNGQVAFNATIAGGTSTSGIFTGTPGSLQAIALQGTTAPGGGLFGTLSTPATLNSSGRVAFNAPLVAAGASTSTSGVFTGTVGSLEAVALQGTAAPAGGNFNAFAATGAGAASSPLLNSAGQVAFQATLTGGSSAAGVFLRTPGSPASIQAVALVGTPAPTPPGGNYTTTFTTPVLNANGQVAFVSLIGTGQGLFAGAPGSLQTAAFGAAPGGVGNFNGITSYSYNNAGQVALSSTLTGGTATAGVFAGTPGALQAIAVQGAAVPGGGGATFNTFANANINAAGQVAFGSGFTGGSGTGGLFQATGGTVQAVALLGGTAPNGTTYAGFSSAELQNGAGQVAFVASLSGPGVVTGTNSAALFAGLPGQLIEIVRQGDLIDVDPGIGIDNRTVTGSISLIINAGGQDGRGSAFNDNGQLLYRLAFSDGSTGVFTSVVPEPTGLALLAVGGLGLVRRRASKR